MLTVCARMSFSKLSKSGVGVNCRDIKWSVATKFSLKQILKTAISNNFGISICRTDFTSNVAY